MKKNTDIEHLVLLSILTCYPTPAVEQNLSPKSNLTDDLGLSSMDIYYLGLSIEKVLQERNLPSLTDAQIMGWKTVADIIRTLTEI